MLHLRFGLWEEGGEHWHQRVPGKGEYNGRCCSYLSHAKFEFFFKKNSTRLGSGLTSLGAGEAVVVVSRTRAYPRRAF